jgi:putative membrane protein
MRLRIARLTGKEAAETIPHPIDPSRRLAMTPFKLAVAAAVAAFLAFSHAGIAQEKGAKGGLAKQDRQAMTKMAQMDMAEIEAGKLAAQNGASPEVKKYGEHMVQEHTKMLEEGKKLAQAKGITPPATPDKKHQQAAKKLQQQSGEAFDREYISQMVKDHEEALKLAEKTAKDAKDPELKAHAQKGAPHIKEHLEQARKLHASLGSSAGASGAKRERK